MAPSLNSMVVLTGAGISAESGIPTFRGLDGIWQGHDPRQLATPQAFQRDPELVWRFYEWRRGLVAEGKPNAAHRQLYEIEQALSDFTLITQNVDGYHQAAGNLDVLELHGSLWVIKCTGCSHRWENHRIPLDKLLNFFPGTRENHQINITLQIFKCDESHRGAFFGGVRPDASN